MNGKLQEIAARKRKEVDSLQIPVPTPRQDRTAFSRALAEPGLSVIAEIKRASPSSGSIAPIDDPVALASDYIGGGARAISVLTDAPFFHGSSSDLQQVAEKFPEIPLLRKDFVIHQHQIYQAVHLGASAILLIVALLGEKMADLVQTCRDVGIEALVEVHTADEIALAVDAGATIIGVNNRCLNTLEVDLATAERLVNLLPKDVLTVAESGIGTPEDAARMFHSGYDAVLVGEALVCADSPQNMARAMGGVANG